MNTVKAALRLILLVIIGACASCIPSENPLSDEKTSTLDKRLLGRWKRIGEENAPVLRVELVKGAKNRLQVIEEKEGAGPPWEILCTRLGGQHFLSMTKKEAKGYIICRYELVDEDTLKGVGAAIQSEAALKRLVKERKLKGTITKVKDGHTEREEVTLSEPTDSLRRFLENHWRDYFSESREKENVAIYKRQK